MNIKASMDAAERSQIRNSAPLVRSEAMRALLGLKHPVPLPPPEFPVNYVRPCRSHFHVAGAWLDTDGEPDGSDMSGCLDLARATTLLLRPVQRR